MMTPPRTSYGPIKRWWLDFIQRRLNPLALRMARSGRGPFSLIRHVGRKSGSVFETPVILARGQGGLVAELTYGTEVNWYRNIVVGGGAALHRGQWYCIVAVEQLPTDRGRRAFAPAARVVLTLLRRHEFRLIRVEPLEGAPDAAH